MIVTVDRRQPAKKNVHRTVAIQGHRGTIWGPDGDTDDRKRPTRPGEAEREVIRTSLIRNQPPTSTKVYISHPGDEN